MRGPEIIQRFEECEEFTGLARCAGQRAEARERDADECAQAAGQHAGGGAFHGELAPPDGHEEQREVARRRDGEGLPDHEVDLQRFHKAAEQHGHTADEHGAPLEHLHALLGRRLGIEHAAIDIVRERAGHGDEQSAEGAHERRERPGAGDAAEDGAEHAVALADDARKFEHDLVRAFRADAGVKLGQQVAPDDAEHGRENVEDADKNHHPHGGARGGDAVRVGVEAHEDVRQSRGAADDGDDERVGVEQRIRLRFFRRKLRGLGGFGGERAEGVEPGGVGGGFGGERHTTGKHFKTRCDSVCREPLL